MAKIISLITIAAVWFLAGLAVGQKTETPAAPQVYFAPGLDPRNAIIAAVGKAQHEILGSAYNFSSPEITAALIAAEKNGVNEQWVIDSLALAEKSCTAGALTAAHIPVFRDSQEKIHHSKYLVIDGRWVVTGSYNFSTNAESNAENLLVIDSVPIATEYIADWKKHEAHSTYWTPTTKAITNEVTK